MVTVHGFASFSSEYIDGISVGVCTLTSQNPVLNKTQMRYVANQSEFQKTVFIRDLGGRFKLRSFSQQGEIKVTDDAILAAFAHLYNEEQVTEKSYTVIADSMVGGAKDTRLYGVTIDASSTIWINYGDQGQYTVHNFIGLSSLDNVREDKAEIKVVKSSAPVVLVPTKGIESLVGFTPENTLLAGFLKKVAPNALLYLFSTDKLDEQEIYGRMFDLLNAYHEFPIGVANAATLKYLKDLDLLKMDEAYYFENEGLFKTRATVLGKLENRGKELVAQIGGKTHFLGLEKIILPEK